MGLDVNFKIVKKSICPKCGELIGTFQVGEAVDSGGRAWYDFLTDIGYYVPFEERDETNDWYGKDMTLTTEQLKKLYKYVKNMGAAYNKDEIKALVAEALCEGTDLVVNADW